MATLDRPMPERWEMGNPNNGTVGPDIASAATIAPTHGMHFITGTAAIVNITVPWDGFAGVIYLIAEGAFTTTAAGNIAKAITAVAATVVILVYNPVKTKWYPQVP